MIPKTPLLTAARPTFSFGELQGATESIVLWQQAAIGSKWTGDSNIGQYDEY